MTALYLLDTNAASALINAPDGSVAVRTRLVGLENVCVSVIVAAELRYGVAKRRSDRLARRVDDLLRAVDVEPFPGSAGVIYGQLRADLERAGQAIGYHDMLIAAHALMLGCILVTDNVGEFGRVPGLSVENWLRP